MPGPPHEERRMVRGELRGLSSFDGGDLFPANEFLIQKIPDQGSVPAKRMGESSVKGQVSVVERNPLHRVRLWSVSGHVKDGKV